MALETAMGFLDKLHNRSLLTPRPKETLRDKIGGSDLVSIEGIWRPRDEDSSRGVLVTSEDDLPLVDPYQEEDFSMLKPGETYTALFVKSKNPGIVMSVLRDCLQKDFVNPNLPEDHRLRHYPVVQINRTKGDKFVWQFCEPSSFYWG